MCQLACHCYLCRDGCVECSQVVQCHCTLAYSQLYFPASGAGPLSGTSEMAWERNDLTSNQVIYMYPVINISVA